MISIGIILGIYQGRMIVASITSVEWNVALVYGYNYFYL